MLSRDEVREILDRANRATPGPWGIELRSSENYPPVTVQLDIPGRREVFFHGPSFLEADGEFVAHARTDVPKLCDALEASEKRVAERDAEIERLKEENERHSKRPTVVCLCGSTKFKDAYQRANARLTLEGKIVLSVGLFGHADRIVFEAEQKALLDRLHLDKIDMADEIFVVNVGGYVGESTRREIARAEATGKPVTYLTRPSGALARPDEGGS